MYDLPLMVRNEYIEREIGAALGKLKEVGLNKGEVEWGEFMRIRVCIGITKPLLRRKMLNIGLLTPIWVRFAYERLLDICFSYGVLGHGHKDCPKWEERKQQCEMKGFLYGNWLRVGQQSGGGATANRQNPMMPQHHATATDTNAEDNPLLATPNDAQQPRPVVPPQTVIKTAPFMVEGATQDGLYKKGNFGRGNEGESIGIGNLEPLYNAQNLLPS